MKQYSSLRPNSDPLGEHIEKTLIQLAGTCGNTQCGAQGMISCVSGLPGLLLYIYIYRLKYRGSSIAEEQVAECSVHPISSRDENDSLSSTEVVSQLFRSTSRGAFPQK